MTLTAPFIVEFGIVGSATLTEFHPGASGSVTLSDPVNFLLPPGWTYTLASQEQLSSIPEPSSLVLAGTGLLGLIGVRRKTLHG
jgi:hypothetical protein